jgi:hypothetical protein
MGCLKQLERKSSSYHYSPICICRIELAQKRVKEIQEERKKVVVSNTSPKNKKGLVSNPSHDSSLPFLNSLSCCMCFSESKARQ